ncbi:MAG: hypothetical protein CMJ42_21160 [Phyllobacteriaceae bacterium]|nr:hypothetical protein [Phyllobacteriaceae bacterium]MBA90846.1 hypothetical protein [Phyllobacteriaceae bacterium]
MVLRIAWALGLASLAVPALAACPQELAVYESADGRTALEFVAGGQAMAMSHEIRILIRDGAPVAAYVQPGAALGQPEMVLPVNCPEGDVTGEELAACIVYRSVVYATDAQGGLRELPAAGETAAQAVLLPNFAASAWRHPAFGDDGPEQPPAEIFRLAGCQE